MTESARDISYYQELPYPREVLASRDGGFVALHPDLPGCLAEGEAVHDTLSYLAEARDLWLQARLEDNEPIPTPATEPSGRLMLRVPIRLHANLDELARAYGKSLNRLLNELLFNGANALPWDQGLGRRDLRAVRPEDDNPCYSYWLTPSPGEGFAAEHPDLPGCISQGSTEIEAMKSLDAARELWIEGRRAEGLPVPDPLSAVHTGIIHLRMPSALHADLARDAHRNGATLNHMISTTLGEACGSLKHDDRLSAQDREQVRAAMASLRNRFDADSPQVSYLEHRRASWAEFLRGVACLEKRDWGATRQHLTRAYRGGLDFAVEAVDICHALPNPLPRAEFVSRLLAVHNARVSDPSLGFSLELLRAGLDQKPDKLGEVRSKWRQQRAQAPERASA